MTITKRSHFWNTRWCFGLIAFSFLVILAYLEIRNRKWVTSSSKMGDQSTVTWPKVILLGDSLTQYSMDPNNGWATILANSLQRRCDVIVRGFVGYNSVMTRHLLPRIENTFDGLVAVVVIFLGANDVANATKNPQQHVPLEKYAENLAWMVQFVKAKGVCADKIILMGPPAVNGEKVTDRDLEQAKKYARKCDEVASLVDVSSVNLCDLMQQKFGNGSWKELLIDGLHFSPEGNAFVASELLPLVTQKMKTHQQLFPVWNEISTDDPAGSINKWTPA
ncbi:unnamed protein product [Notodromas monacha]|uniref:SGNH hydrolase-type esterase domain-containing protein n=1 Tax=Notodromas monacha TaxID=399045 RepID=A0A7R9BFM3_9CRUS|nr:unnamed protein product [Notodromas monacha]CAG0913225.1 unnamed protein product [Notodromas monacha]